MIECMKKYGARSRRQFAERERERMMLRKEVEG